MSGTWPENDPEDVEYNRQKDLAAVELGFPCWCEVCGKVLESEYKAGTVTVTHPQRGTYKAFCCLTDCEPHDYRNVP